MKTAAAAIATIAITLLTPACATASTNAAPPTPTRVMILGDSITQGAVGHHTWRYFFSQSVDGVDFVGNKSGTFSIYGGDWDYRGENAYAASGWDSDHAAVWGGSMTNPNPEPKLHQLPIGDLTATYQPDVIVSAWGINDLNSGVTPAALIAHYEGWITEAREQQPGVDFVISELAWTWGSFGTRAADFNAMLDGLADRQATETSQIVIARMAESYTKDADTYDGIHPNRQGEEKIARMIFAAHERIAASTPDAPGPAPASPVETQPTISTQPDSTTAPPSAEPAVRVPAPRELRAVRKGKRVVVTWGRVGAAESYRVKCGARAMISPRTKAVIHASSNRCKVRSLSETGASGWAVVRVKQQRA